MTKKKAVKKVKSNKSKNEFFGTIWTCMECPTGTSMQSKAFLEHLQTAHNANCDAKQIKASMRMTMHMDGSDWFSSNYEGEAIFPDGRKVKCLRYERTKRTGESAMYWGA